MFEPLREILPEDPQALIDDARLLGEKAGRLYGSRSAATYAALGGATYRPLQCVNEGVVAWDNDASADLSTGSSSTPASSSLHRSSDGSSSGSIRSSWISKALSLLGSARYNSRCRSHRAHPPQRRRRPPTGLYAVQEVLSAMPHIVPHLLHCALKVAAFVFPSVRTLCPSALPDTWCLLDARQSCRGGPERVTALSFHPLYLWLAVAVDEGAADGSARVVLYDVAEEKVACVLSHAFQKDVNWLHWKPYATDVLAVGCRGGVLLWSLAAATATGAESGWPGHAGRSFGASSQLDSSARALFYRTCDGFTVTSAAFSHRDGSMLACASLSDTRLHLLNVRQPPFSPLACAAVVVPSVDGGLYEVLFDDDDLFMICVVCEHPSLALVRCAALSSTASAASAGVLQTTVVPIPAPVHCMARASGLGPSLFFLATKGLEGVLLARINPVIGVEVVAMISTGLYRGVGGRVTRVACSRRRLWMHTETNHLVVCRYGQHGGNVTLLPVGVATMEAVALVNVEGCATGSLVAVLEQDGTITMIPSYHS
ncbi:hypothetical protein ABB37_07837 [Leptomonas pyrrhocoris]|uniref:Uncharacterized protein n=1 Tax=Leptomonas pyrrhocoris TaxID=157538 RepID=A0A0M9FV69_LEPPY|nr:hypothetical protein ABB37_07837 [Leptomonas pyrrhocoris]KPA76546.1 hypothetical protein ABB37_07837 [Leptomonas pyrrhocoris]|eukprot:XP_015654985.1 hypothetical protein ABB37_07837 [Leptomonas pyrrhocoris]